MWNGRNDIKRFTLSTIVEKNNISCIFEAVQHLKARKSGTGNIAQRLAMTLALVSLTSSSTLAYLVME
jgi:hypothetical protein